MGNKVSAVNGVRSPDIYQPGNAVNEIWINDFELISRLPFGDSDMAQAGWPKGDYPKIPWRPFIIPLRAVVTRAAKSLSVESFSLSRRSLVPPPPGEMFDALANSIGPWVIVLFLSALFFLGPIVIYHVPRPYSKGRQQLSCSRLVDHALECGSGEYHTKAKSHLTLALVIIAQSLGDAGLCMMYFAMQRICGRFSLHPGGNNEHTTVLQICVVLLATVSRAYMMGIWWEYFRGYRRSNSEDGGLQVVQPDYIRDSDQFRSSARGS